MFEGKRTGPTERRWGSCIRLAERLSQGFLRVGIIGLAGLCLLAESAEALQRRPLPLEANPDLFQRVITLPKAQLFIEPGSSARVLQSSLPIFEVFYVYGRKSQDGVSWVQVGRGLRGIADGWIPADRTQDWSIMLVMEYEEPGQRERVLFFKELEELKELVWAPDVKKQAKQLLNAVDAGRPDKTKLIAVEEIEEGFVTFGSNPYLMPILSAVREEFDDGAPVTLVNVASISAELRSKPVRPLEKPISQARRAIVFVIDTTSSMGPYIERARETARRIYDEVGKAGLLERTSFGLVGYRNNMDAEPQRSRLEYVSRVFQPLDPDAPPEKILDSLDRMSAATVSTHSWDEDAVAGLHDALWGMNWEPFNELRLVILITDAGSLREDDPKARHYKDRIGLWNVREKAAKDNVALLPIHLLTPEAERAGNTANARRQYRQLGATGDVNVSKYTPVGAGSVSVFAQQLDTLASDLKEVAARADQGIPEEKPTLQRLEGSFTLGSLFRNEVYRAQQRYLGDVKGAEAVTFYQAWASDKDLTQYKHSALKVRVFLTRNQLNELAQSLAGLLDQARRAKESPDLFFDRLRALAALTASDPDRYGAGFSNIVESGLLPSYLELLPYKSRVLRLTEDTWHDLGPAGQLQFIDELEYKLTQYRDINEDRRKWKGLGAKDPGLEVYPVPLSILP